MHDIKYSLQPVNMFKSVHCSHCNIVFLYTAYIVIKLATLGAPHLVQPLSSAGNFKCYSESLAVIIH